MSYLKQRPPTTRSKLKLELRTKPDSGLRLEFKLQLVLRAKFSPAAITPLP